MANTPKIYLHDQEKNILQICHQHNITPIEHIRTISKPLTFKNTDKHVS